MKHFNPFVALARAQAIYEELDRGEITPTECCERMDDLEMDYYGEIGVIRLDERLE